MYNSLKKIMFFRNKLSSIFDYRDIFTYRVPEFCFIIGRIKMLDAFSWDHDYYVRKYMHRYRRDRREGEPLVGLIIIIVIVKVIHFDTSKSCAKTCRHYCIATQSSLSRHLFQNQVSSDTNSLCNLCKY